MKCFCFFIHIKLNADWVGIPESILENQEEKKKNICKKPTTFFGSRSKILRVYTLSRKDKCKDFFFLDNPFILTNICLLPALKKIPHKYFCFKEHKPTGQAVGTDPSWCNSINRKNPPMQQNCHNSWASLENLLALKIYNILKSLTQSILWLKAPSPTVWPLRRHTDIFTKDEWVTQLLN